MSVKAVKDYIDLSLQGESTIKAKYEIILEQKQQLEELLKEMNDRHHYMEQKVNWYLDIINHRVPNNSNPGTWNNSDVESKE